jgi:four helix bundle protein
MKRAPAKNFQDPIVWQKAHQFVLDVYRLAERFPKSEIYGLTSQFKRAAVSIPANITEGFKKRSRNDKTRYMNIAQDSIEECRYYLILVKDLRYAEIGNTGEQLDEIGRLLDAYLVSLLTPVS